MTRSLTGDNEPGTSSTRSQHSTTRLSTRGSGCTSLAHNYKQIFSIHVHTVTYISMILLVNV